MAQLLIASSSISFRVTMTTIVEQNRRSTITFHLKVVSKKTFETINSKYQQKKCSLLYFLPKKTHIEF